MSDFLVNQHNNRAISITTLRKNIIKLTEKLHNLTAIKHKLIDPLQRQILIEIQPTINFRYRLGKQKINGINVI